MDDLQRNGTVRDAEQWFDAHGLPYFVRAQENSVRAALNWSRLVPVAALALVLAGAGAVVVGLGSSDVSNGVLLGALVLGVVLLSYAMVSLHFTPIVRWAVGQTFGSLGWIFPLVTRALPLLLLFITFLFINTEVWQVSSALDRGLLWLTVLLFVAVAVAFLLVRLPEEVRKVSAEARGERLRSICKDTPVAAVADEVTGEAADVVLSPLQRTNLVLVLLFAQALQVLLLSITVFLFFIAFGKVAISDDVIATWVGGNAPTDLPSLNWLPISNELFQVSVFLAAFSGFYFTVYAVTDEKYRQQFFTGVSEELERAIGVQVVYQHLTRDSR